MGVDRYNEFKSNKKLQIGHDLEKTQMTITYDYFCFDIKITVLLIILVK